MQIVVLASGIVRRTGPGPADVPESLLQINGRPFIDWQLDRFMASGVRSVVLCVGPLGEEIETHVRRALERGMTAGYSYEGAEPIGTGGALRRAYARLESEFVVTYGDRYVPFDYAAPLADLRAHPDALATMGVCPGSLGLAPNDLALDGDRVIQYGQAPTHALNGVDGGVIALRRSALTDIADGAVWDLGALWRRLAQKRQLRALVIPERVYGIRSPDHLGALERHLSVEARESAGASF